MSREQWRRLFGLLTVLAGAAILFVCTRPVAQLRQAHYPQVNEWFDAMNHFLAFLVWQGLFRLGFGQWPAAPRWVVSAGFAAFCELVQLWVPTRGFQLLDMTVNVLPVLVWECPPPVRRLWLADGPVWARLAKAFHTNKFTNKVTPR